MQKKEKPAVPMYCNGTMPPRGNMRVKVSLLPLTATAKQSKGVTGEGGLQLEASVIWMQADNPRQV